MVNLDDMAVRALVPEQLPHYVQSVSALRQYCSTQLF